MTFNTINIILILSVFLNIALLWYIREVLTKLWFLADNTDELQHRLKLFAEHVTSVYELEMYYGDTTLEALLEHSKEISEYIKEYEEIYSLVHKEEELADADEES
tara:strand:+ start:145 stop:459 length:315 start_codon:yes stop_codon:yes gene_type:complete